MSPMTILAAGTSALAVWLVARTLVPPPRRLRGRVEPYVSPTLLGLTGRGSSGALLSVFGPIVSDVANWVGARLDRAGSGVTLIRLRQAGFFKGQSEEQMLIAYRVSQLKSLVVAVVAALTVGQLVSASPILRIALIGLALVVGTEGVSSQPGC